MSMGIMYKVLAIGLAACVLTGCSSGCNSGDNAAWNSGEPSAWYGLYEPIKSSGRFELSETAFEFSVLLDGKYRPHVRISPYERKAVSGNDLIISGTDVNSATHETVTYRIVKTDGVFKLEKHGGVFSGSRGTFRKRAEAEH